MMLRTLLRTIGTAVPATPRTLASGLASYLPGAPAFLASSMKTGGTSNARYCYSVWLRHLVMAHRHGLTRLPHTVAELGPGASLGIGLAALLSGVERYYSLDTYAHCDPANNLKVFEELLCLFLERAPIPDDQEFPEVRPRLQSYAFPSDILETRELAKALISQRVQSIRDAITAGAEQPQERIRYYCPWNDPSVIRDEAVDMILSQAVMEHVDGLPWVYGALGRWLKPGGLMSHTVDFRSHGTAKHWNGHWSHSDLIWALMRGRRPYLLNRQPYSVHLAFTSQCGFEILCTTTDTRPSEVAKSDLAPAFRGLSDEDLSTSTAYILASKSAALVARRSEVSPRVAPRLASSEA
jgi:hypothetical protein